MHGTLAMGRVRPGAECNHCRLELDAARPHGNPSQRVWYGKPDASSPGLPSRLIAAAGADGNAMVAGVKARLHPSPRKSRPRRRAGARRRAVEALTQVQPWPGLATDLVADPARDKNGFIDIELFAG